jgi:hypothetical protein
MLDISLPRDPWHALEVYAGDFAAACPNYWTLLLSSFLMAKPTANQQTRTFFSPSE